MSKSRKIAVAALSSVVLFNFLVMAGATVLETLVAFVALAYILPEVEIGK